EFESLPQRSYPQLPVVVDTNIFARRAWLGPIICAAPNEYIVPVWSPCIIAEASRLLTWLELKRRGCVFSSADARALSERAHRWFAVMTRVFQVVDGHPPYESI